MCSAFDNYFLQAQRARKRVREDFDRAFLAENELAEVRDRNWETSKTAVDVVLHPSAIRTAPMLTETSMGLDGYVQDVLTVPASLAGVPAISIPAGVAADGWPIGVSIVGQWGHDDVVLRVSEIIRNITRR